MDPLTLGAIAGGTGLLGAGLGLAGTLSTNATNSANVAATNAANVAAVNSTNTTNQNIASGQEAFQQQMSDTSYQRSKADLLAAGFNPMLAVSNGGASTPSGASIPMQAPKQEAFQGKDWGPGLQQGVTGAMTAAIGGANSALDLQNKAAQIGNLDADTKNKLLTGEGLPFDNSRKESDAKTAAISASVKQANQGAEVAKGALDLANARTDLKYQGLDQLTKRGKDVSDVVGNVVDLIPGVSTAGRIIKGWIPK